MPTYLPNHTLLNRYRIERFIGAGAFAEVYLATHRRQPPIEIAGCYKKVGSKPTGQRLHLIPYIGR